MRIWDGLVRLDDRVLGPAKPLPSLRQIDRALVIGVTGTVCAVIASWVMSDWTQLSVCVFVSLLAVLELLRERRLVLRNVR